jgi:hypothetical protein
MRERDDHDDESTPIRPVPEFPDVTFTPITSLRCAKCRGYNHQTDEHELVVTLGEAQLRIVKGQSYFGQYNRLESKIDPSIYTAAHCESCGFSHIGPCQPQNTFKYPYHDKFEGGRISDGDDHALTSMPEKFLPKENLKQHIIPLEELHVEIIKGTLGGYYEIDVTTGLGYSYPGSDSFRRHYTTPIATDQQPAAIVAPDDDTTSTSPDDDTDPILRDSEED